VKVIIIIMKPLSIAKFENDITSVFLD